MIPILSTGRTASPRATPRLHRPLQSTTSTTNASWAAGDREAHARSRSRPRPLGSRSRGARSAVSVARVCLGPGGRGWRGAEPRARTRLGGERCSGPVGHGPTRLLCTWRWRRALPRQLSSSERRPSVGASLDAVLRAQSFEHPGLGTATGARAVELAQQRPLLFVFLLERPESVADDLAGARVFATLLCTNCSKWSPRIRLVVLAMLTSY